MKTFKKKLEDMDMLIVHKPPTASVRKDGKESVPDLETNEAGRKRLVELKERLRRTRDLEEIEKILEIIQSDFGNDVTERIIKELRLAKDEDDGS